MRIKVIYSSRACYPWKLLYNSSPHVPYTPCLIKYNPINHLQVLAVVDSGGDSDGLSGNIAGGDGRGDTPARAGGGVLNGVVARRGVGGDVGGQLGLGTDLVGVVALELGGLVAVDSDGDGGGAGFMLV